MSHFDCTRLFLQPRIGSSIPPSPRLTNAPPTALERTYLSYYRTSLVLCFLSVLIAQLQVLQRAPHPDPHFGFYVLGKPLAASLIVCAIFVSVMGWVRWWHWQKTLLRGKAMAGGWEVKAVGGVVGLLMVVIFGLVLAVDVKKIYFS
ncbi:hypothetical protein K440DRAFT_635537 [Wilcoxina mikolae CBS 423.85]|nr:hypothetical protein K440DRAFT_635537 [Wilcoxina mikolae CBS 423.85]